MEKLKMRMDAYHYYFISTGVLAVDKILSAVACAGKSYHNTEDWNERSVDNPKSCVDLIQQAADECAAEIKEAQATASNK